MLFAKKEQVHPEQNRIVRFATRHLRVTHEYHGERFFTRIKGKLFATPLFLVLVVVEMTDITLAIDSIPAIFGITRMRSSFTPRTCSRFSVCARCTSCSREF